jgi:L-asparaginase
MPSCIFMSAVKLSVLIAALVSVPFPEVESQGVQNDKPRILIITTGGTIASRTSAPMIEGHELVQAVPQLLDHADISVEEFSRVGSSQMTPDHWMRLARLINAQFAADPELKGIVITHGTDTMDETAYFLNLTVKSSRPVILVGSMRSSNEISPDGPANLLNAVRVACAPESLGKGVMIVLNESISAARETVKLHNRRVETFQSPDFGFLGQVNPDGVYFYRAPLHRHTANSDFSLPENGLPNVAIIADYTGFDPALLDRYTSTEFDGLVINTFAGGRLSGGMREALSGISRANFPVVICSRVPAGRIAGAPEYDYPAILSRDLPAQKARILLTLALTRSRGLDDIRRYFEVY